MRFFNRRPERAEIEQRTATQFYLDGGGSPADARTMEILAEADRSHQQRNELHMDNVATDSGPLHAHEVTANDAAMIRMMAGAHFGSNAMVTLPSGRTISGSEMQRWLDANREG